MLRKTAYTLLIAAIILNIGAGIYYNGIPPTLKRILDGGDDGPVADMDVLVPISRSGDIVTSTYNLSIELVVASDDGDNDRGELEQSGMITRSLSVTDIRSDLTGAQVLSYSNPDTEEIKLLGDLKISRNIFYDPEQGGLVEERSTIMETASPVSGKSQISTVDIRLNRPRGSWHDMLWRAILPQSRTFNSSSSGTLLGPLSIDELGLFFRSASFGWNVVSMNDDLQGPSALIEARSEGLEGLEILYMVRFSERSPYPQEMELVALGSYSSDDGVVEVNMRMAEFQTDIFMGSGSEISWDFDNGPGTDGAEVKVKEHEPVPVEGGDTYFWSSPVECLDHAANEGNIISDFISEHGRERTTSFASSYYRNESIMGGSRVWNITLVAPDGNAPYPAISFQVASQVGSDILGLKRLELISESRHTVPAYPDPARSMISLHDHETALKICPLADRMISGVDYTASYGLDIISRDGRGKGPLSTLLYATLGMEREHARDLFISHSVDRYDPLKIYIVVVDGYSGEVLSYTEASGFGTLLLNSYGLDLA
ncbi:MAG: hypothetical protein ACMUHB_05255 [Thermoplasmatota archaeon]